MSNIEVHGHFKDPTPEFAKAMGEVVKAVEKLADAGPATPDAPMRDWACNRCMYSWNDCYGPWCPCCGEQPTHGKAFAE